MYGLQAPCLTLGPFSLAPDNRLPVRVKNQVPASPDFESISSRFITIQKEGLTDGVLVRASFNRDAVFNQYVGGLQDVFAAVHEIGEMMKPIFCATSIEGDRQIIGLKGCRQPAAHFGAVIENDLLGHTKPEQLLEELPVGFNVTRSQGNVV